MTFYQVVLELLDRGDGLENIVLEE